MNSRQLSNQITAICQQFNSGLITVEEMKAGIKTLMYKVEVINYEEKN